MANAPEGFPKPSDSSLKLEDLLKTYRSLDKIPDQALEEIGYERVGPGEISRAGLRTQEKADQARLLKEKIDNAPFGEVEVSLQENELTFRMLPAKDAIGLIRDADTLNNSSLMVPHLGDYFPPESDILRFESEFESFIHDGFPDLPEDQKNDILDKIFDDQGAFVLENSVREFLFKTDIISIVQDSRDDDGNIPSAKTEEIYGTLERARGYFTDVSQHAKEFREGFDQKESSLGQQGTMQWFSQFLDKKDMEDVAAGLRACHSIDEAHAFLLAHRDKLPLSLYNEEQGIKEKIKTAPLEEKKTMSQRLKELREERKRRTRLIQGVNEYFSLPQLTADFFERKIKGWENLLVRGGEGSKENVFYLNALPDEELDRDPGVVSGDCTQGKPLPFTDPKVSIYNVKVFNFQREHIGNIYLLQTTGSDETEKVWHLDAIQVPSSIEWESAIPAVIGRLASEAEKKGIAMITVNEEIEGVSNYDYIRDAMKAHCEKTRAPEDQINIPMIEDDRYSDFQGDGRVKVIWKNPHIDNEK